MNIIREREIEAIKHFEAAVAADIGIEVEIVAGARIEEVLAFYYKVRNQDDRYKQYSLLRTPDHINSRFWIIRRAENSDNETRPVLEGG